MTESENQRKTEVTSDANSGAELGIEPEYEEEALDMALDQHHLSPLSIQASALVRSIDALSNIFWISLGGTFLTIFFCRSLPTGGKRHNRLHLSWRISGTKIYFTLGHIKFWHVHILADFQSPQNVVPCY